MVGISNGWDNSRFGSHCTFGHLNNSLIHNQDGNYLWLLCIDKNTKFCFQEPWNPSGSNILNENWPFPIFMVDNNVTVNFLRYQCFENFNKPNETTNESRDWPLCAIELQVYNLSLCYSTVTCNNL